MTRARGSCAARRISFIVDGSRAVVWGRDAAHRYLLELGNLLKDAVFENLDIGLLKVGDGLPIRRRVHIDADVIDFGSEGLGRGWILGRRSLGSL